MAGNDSVVIKISGDIKDYTAKLEAVQKETEDLSKSLNKTGLVAGVTFAAVTAGAVKAVSAFKESIKPGLELQNILKNQGIYSAKLVNEYNDIAEELKKITGVDDKVITSGQAVIQRFIGQTKVTKELTQAVLDFAAGTGVDTVTAFNLVGKSIGTNTNALSKYGIEINENLTAQEKLSVFMAQVNSKFRDQAAVLKETKGPLLELKDSFDKIVEGVGESLAPIVESITGGLNGLSKAAAENKGTGDTVAAIAVAVGTLAGGALIVSQLATSFVAVNAAAVALGITVTALTGGLALLAVAIGGIAAVTLTANKSLQSMEVLTERLKKSEEELAEMRKNYTNSFGQAREIAMKVDEINIIKRQINEAKKLNDEKEKSNKISEEKRKLDQAAAKDANKLNEEGEKRAKAKADREKAADEEIKERKNLAKSLVDAGKSEYEALEDLRQRRLKLAGTDADLRLQIEKDYQSKLTELTTKSAEENTRKLQEEYDKRQAAQKKAFDDSVANPFSAIDTIQNAQTQEEKDAAGVGAGVGVLNQVANGKEGARNLIVEGAATGIDSFLPGAGQALKPLIGALSQGPEATKAFVKEFAEGVPEIIGALVEAIPVFVEELSNQVPVIVDKLLQKVPDIIGAIVRATPKIIAAQVQEAPKVIMAMVKNVPNLIQAFIDGLRNGAGDFVQALIDAVNPFSSDGAVGGFFSDVGDFLGFAEGGQASVKRVPSGFAGDRFPAFLSSDELVVKPDVARDLESFLNSQAGRGSGMTDAILMDILGALREPLQVTAGIEMEGRALANAILDLTRSNSRIF